MYKSNLNILLTNEKSVSFLVLFGHDIIGRFTSTYAGDDAGRAILYSPDFVLPY